MKSKAMNPPMKSSGKTIELCVLTDSEREPDEHNSLDQKQITYFLVKMLKFYIIFNFLQNLQRDTSSKDTKKKSKQHREKIRKGNIKRPREQTNNLNS